MEDNPPQDATITAAASTGIRVSLAVSGDEPGLVALFCEVQAYYRVPCPPEDAILSDLRALPAGVTLLVARAPAIVGVAALAAVWPGPGLRRGLFLKELFVAASHRNQGVGASLMRAAARFAVDGGWHRIDWTADRDDAALLAFYRRLEATELSDKLFFRLAGATLHARAARAHEGPLP